MVVHTVSADKGIGVSFCVSAVIHMTVFLLVLWQMQHTPRVSLQETYYVDVVNLPVLSPQAGTPHSGGAQEKPPPVDDSPRPMTHSAPPQTLPAAARQKMPVMSKKGSDAAAASEEFSSRMAKLERAAEAQQTADALSRLRQKLSSQGGGRPGMPAAAGREAGSDYLAYLQSRLKDAFSQTISSTSASPEVTVRLFIDPAGKITRRKTERSSGDRAFEISVLRAIDVASEKIPPPPQKKMFEGVFVFRREGITPK